MELLQAFVASAQQLLHIFKFILEERKHRNHVVAKSPHLFLALIEEEHAGQDLQPGELWELAKKRHEERPDTLESCCARIQKRVDAWAAQLASTQSMVTVELEAALASVVTRPKNFVTKMQLDLDRLDQLTRGKSGDRSHTFSLGACNDAAHQFEQILERVGGYVRVLSRSNGIDAGAIGSNQTANHDPFRGSINEKLGSSVVIEQKRVEIERRFSDLNDREREILQALFELHAIGPSSKVNPTTEQVAKKAGYEPNSAFKNSLSTLRKAGYLENGRSLGRRGGYFIRAELLEFCSQWFGQVQT